MTFSHLSLKSCTHIHTIESTTASSPQTWQIWWWISASLIPFVFKKRIVYLISCVVGIFIFFDIKNEPKKAYSVHQLFKNGIIALPMNHQTSCTCATAWWYWYHGNIQKWNLLCRYPLWFNVGAFVSLQKWKCWSRLLQTKVVAPLFFVEQTIRGLFTDIETACFTPLLWWCCWTERLESAYQ